MKTRADFERKLLAVEAQMLARIEEIRATLGHAGNKGAHVEEVLRQFLREYLPRRLGVGHGEIIDRQYRGSGQVDVVIASEDHPATYTNSDSGLFFVEGVSAYGEVKTVLTSTNLRQTVLNATASKKLEIVPTRGTVFNMAPNELRYYRTPPFFLFAFATELSLDSIVRHLREATSAAHDPGSSIDAVFVLGTGSSYDLGNGDGSFAIINPETKRPYTGWIGNRNPALFAFLSWLSVVMPRFVGGSSILGSYLIHDVQSQDFKNE